MKYRGGEGWEGRYRKARKRKQRKREVKKNEVKKSKEIDVIYR